MTERPGLLVLGISENYLQLPLWWRFGKWAKFETSTILANRGIMQRYELPWVLLTLTKVLWAELD
jgi:hypothetical protein